MTLGRLRELWDDFFFTPQSPLPIALFRTFYGICVSATILLLRLHTAGLPRRYPWFATSLAFFVAYSLAVAGVPGTSRAYLYAYLAGEGLSLLLNILIIRECLDHLRESYPGAAPRYLRRVFAWAATIALGLCAISIVPDAAALHVRGKGFSFIALFLLLTRSVNSSLWRPHSST